MKKKMKKNMKKKMKKEDEKYKVFEKILKVAWDEEEFSDEEKENIYKEYNNLDEHSKQVFEETVASILKPMEH